MVNKMKSLKRKEFEKAKWISDRLGHPINPKADLKCRECGGHGIVDVGYTGCSLENCPSCHIKDTV